MTLERKQPMNLTEFTLAVQEVGGAYNVLS